MAHQRILKHEFFTDYDVAQMPPLHRIFFQGLWCQADRNGVVEYKPHQLKARCMPYDDLDAVGAIDDMVTRGFVIRFKVGDREYLYIRSWKKNQPVHNSERHSGLPDFEQKTEIVALPILRKDVPVSSPVANVQLPAPPSPVPVPVPSPVPVPDAAPGPAHHFPKKTFARVIEKPTKPEDEWLFEDFEQWFQFKRQEAGLVPERFMHGRKGSDWWNEARMTPGVTVKRIKRAVYLFGENEHWKGEGLPLAGFISQWDQFCSKEAVNARAG